MAKRTDKERDKVLIARLQAEVPEVLKAKLDFDSIVDQIVKTAPPEKQQRVRKKNQQGLAHGR